MSVGLVENQLGTCKRCGDRHRYLTHNCRPVVMPIGQHRWGDANVFPWRWRMLAWTDWWSMPYRHARFRCRRWRCRWFGHDLVSPSVGPGEHRILACRRCYHAFDLETDDVQARDGRVLFHIGEG